MVLLWRAVVREGGANRTTVIDIRVPPSARPAAPVPAVRLRVPRTAGRGQPNFAGGGLYWLVPGVLAAIVFGLVNAWVLLVEILR